MRVEEGTTPPSGSSEETTARLGTHGRYPYSGVVSRSKVQCLIGVRALSGFRVPGPIRGPWNRGLATPDLTNPVFFCLTYKERVISRVFPELKGREPPPCWLGLAAVGGSYTSVISSATS